MKKNVKIALYIIAIVSLLLVIKSRIVSQSTFDLMVLMDTNEVLESCKKRLEAQGQNINNIDREDNYYIKMYGENICLQPEKLKQIIEEDQKSRLKDNWLILF